MASNNKTKRVVAQRLKKIKKLKEKIYDIIIMKEAEKGTENPKS